ACDGREGVPEIVDPPQQFNAGSFLSRAPLERSEVVDVEVAAALAGKEQWRTVAVPDSIERLESPRLQRDRSRAGFRLRDLQLTSREGAAHVDDPVPAGRGRVSRVRSTPQVAVPSLPRT